MKRIDVAVLLVLFSLIACDDAASDATFRVETLPSGTPHAVNTGAGTWSDSARWTARIGLRLGRVEGEGPDLFGSISAVELDDDGRLYVLDGQAQDVRVFEPDGTHLTTLGRPGEGPGELRGAAGLNIDADGNLWIWDPGNARFSAFAPDGRFIRGVPRRVAGVIYPWRGEIDESSGAMIDWGLDRPQAKSSYDPGRRSVFYPIRVDLASGALDTLAALTYEASSDYEFRVPFRGSLGFSVGSSGDIWVANTGDYRLHRVSFAGDTALVVSRLGIQPMPVTAAERDSVLARPDPLGDMIGQPLEAGWIPTHKPVLSRIITDGAGHLLVFPRLADHDLGTVVDVFRIENGEFLGQVDLPVRLEMTPPPVAGRGILVGVTRGELDVPLVVRLDLGR